MNERRFFHRLISLRLAAIMTALLLSAATTVALADPPKPRIKVGGAANAEKPAPKAPPRGNSAPRGASVPAGVGSSSFPRTPAREVNDGALPPVDDELLELTEQARDVRNWLDPETTGALREFVLDAAKERCSRWPEYPKLDPKKADAENIRHISVGHIEFYTDLPSNPDVDQIPEALDAATPLLCDFFNVDRALFDDWKIEAFLMKDVDAFIRFGALDGPPLFLYGYSDRDRIFAKDQKVAYYNRFLLVHELVHSFMHAYFGELRPRWFSEGSAEYIALHNWDPKKKEIELAQIPVSENAYPGFGRLRQVRQIVASGRAPTILEIMNLEPRDYVDVSAYAWSWSFVMFLNNSPKYKDVAELLPYWMLANDPNGFFIDAIGPRWAELERDWADFLDQIDYGYDFKATAIGADVQLDDAPTDAELQKGVVLDVDPSRGWQNSGLALEPGRKYKLTVGGKFDYYLESAKRVFSFEGTGATIEYFNAIPVGRVLAVVAPETEEATFDEVYGFGDRTAAFGGGRHTRFGGARPDESSGFSADALETLKKKEPKPGANDGRRFDYYNALYPWNEAVAFASSSFTIEPETPGTLWLRVNGPSRNFRKNSGSVKVQVKLVE